MGLIEEKGRKSRKNKNIQRTVLSVVGIAGILAVTAMAPTVFQALPQIMGKKRYKLAFEARNAVDRLVIKGYVRRVRRDGKTYLEITDRGRQHLRVEEARTRSPARAKRKWDGRYRLVMFDIPEQRKSTRERLRRLMIEFGFMRLQNSVWISPYDCEELIALVKAELRIGSAVLYALVDQIEQEYRIKEHFGLS
ncbi:CRISPR-associated endonuclease Cas2 [Candidatus Kaiserbacteria bacterium]|nr:CRISPR-associated endonuclease Cas2 [Candidatus Kaiserbacteria bacterium]